MIIYIDRIITYRKLKIQFINYIIIDTDNKNWDLIFLNIAVNSVYSKISLNLSFFFKIIIVVFFAVGI